MKRLNLFERNRVYRSALEDIWVEMDVETGLYNDGHIPNEDKLKALEKDGGFFQEALNSGENRVMAEITERGIA